ncbi:hypothetical protein D770_13300 [Flammeovirgaceae bacterium 311]|nr:hypothetical protein D770_13300 [Flammeovirgaceae bacterium 311]
MARTSVLSQRQTEIENFFDSLPDKSFSYEELVGIFDRHKEEWDIPKTNTSTQFINFLKEKTPFKSAELIRDEQGQPKTLFIWKAKDNLSIIRGLKKNGYYTHYTAMYLHGLTLQIPKVYYLNTERSQNPAPNYISQEAINLAFSKEQRKTSLSYSYGDKKVYLLNSKNTAELGVRTFKSQTEYYHYTDLERTLIDIAIRPAYAGGVFEVLEAYKRAKGKVDPVKLSEYLEELDFAYPYHQTIGFYMDKACYSSIDTALFNKRMHLDFYLTYNMKDKQFSDKWRLFYPKGM